MSSHAKQTTATVIPCLRYRDALAMIEWLRKAFGFERHAVHADGDVVHHAQLTFGHGMIMLGSVDNGTAWGRRIVQPDEIGRRETQACYVDVTDCAAHYTQARAAGAEIVDGSKPGTTAATATARAIREATCGRLATTIRGRNRSHEKARCPHHG